MSDNRGNAGAARKKAISRLSQILVTALCFWYLLHDLDFAMLLESVRGYSTTMLLLSLLVFLPITIPPSIRLNYLTGGRAGFWGAAGAVYFGNGVNNLLPAKLGELAKAVYLSRTRGISVAESLCAVFWERLADLNAVLLFSVIIGLFFGVKELYLPLLLGMAVIWIALLLLFRYPGQFLRMAGFLPEGRLRAFSVSVIDNLGQPGKRPGWALLMLISIVSWIGYIAFTHWFLIYVCGFDISLSGSALVTIAAGIGMILPSMPASLGAFEAGAVAALSILNVDKSASIGAAFALHIVQIVHYIAFAGKVMLFDNISIYGQSGSTAEKTGGNG